jgi:hypothetical protein
MRIHAVIAAGILAGLLASPGAGFAQSVNGQATAVSATVAGLLGGITTTLGSTGTLSGPTDAREASLLSGNVLSGLTAEALHATTIGWPDQVASQASVANLALSLPGAVIGADLVIAQAQSVLNGASSGSSSLSNLLINGLPVAVSGAPNQSISIPGGLLVINQQSASASGIVVNALRVVVYGVADVVVGSATAGIQ